MMQVTMTCYVLFQGGTQGSYNRSATITWRHKNDVTVVEMICGNQGSVQSTQSDYSQLI